MRTELSAREQRRPPGDVSRSKDSALISQHAVLLFVLGAVLLALNFPVNAQQSGRTPKIGVLYSGSRTSGRSSLDAFQQGLRELGYVEGKDVLVEYRYGDGETNQLPPLANELVRLKPDVLVTAGSPGIDALREATRTTPIVFAAIGDAVGRGYVQSLSKPGTNLTGLSFLDKELASKRMELLKEVLPRLSRLAVLRHARSSTLGLGQLRSDAQALSLRLEVLAAQTPDDFESAFSTARKNRAQAILVLASPIFFAHRKNLVALAAKYRLPAAYEFSEFVEAGGFVSYAASLSEMWRRAATYVDKILKGRKPAELPIEQPTKFELVINLKTASRLGVTIPADVLIRADQVIK